MAEERFSPVKDFLMTFIMPEKCYDRLILQLKLTDGPCVNIVLSKFLSVWILGELIAPLFQVCVLVWGGSADGLSLVSVFLQLLAVSSHTAACIIHRFPIGAYGESVFLLLQFVLLFLLIHFYREKTITGCVVMGVYCSVMYACVCVVRCEPVVMAMQQWCVLIIISSQLIQAGWNLNSGSTGQLSAVCVFLVFLASLGRAFRSAQESHSLHCLAYVFSSCCCLMLLLQIHKTSTNRETTNRRKED